MDLWRRIALTISLMGMASIGLPADSGQVRPVADLGLQVDMPPGPSTPPGSSGKLTFRVTNFGPDAAGTLPYGRNVHGFSEPIPYSVYYGSAVHFVPVPGAACTLIWVVPDPIPGDDPVILYNFTLPALEPGESAVCELEFHVNRSADAFAGSTTIFSGWFVNATRDDDPNPANDEVTVLFRLAELTVDVPTLSPGGLMVLILVLSSTCLGTLRRQLKRSKSHKESTTY